MASGWYQIGCEIPSELSEGLADFLTEISGCGVCTDNRAVDTFSTIDIPETRSETIMAYFALPCQINTITEEIFNFMKSQGAALPGYQPQPPIVELISEEDWGSSWKEHFKPMPIGKRLLVTPSWEKQEDNEDRLVITLDPGMAFGTGGHETTRLCLECLENILEDTLPLKPDISVLDLGTGSGLLAIAAAKLGARKIEAVDIDPQAVAVAEENCRLNMVDKFVNCRTTPIDRLDGSYGLILANILAEELVRLAPDIIKRLAPGGSLVLSGILAEKEQFVTTGFSGYPLTLVKSCSDGEWICLEYRSLS